jgi:hypothetical protein
MPTSGVACDHVEIVPLFIHPGMEYRNVSMNIKTMPARKKDEEDFDKSHAEMKRAGVAKSRCWELRVFESRPLRMNCVYSSPMKTECKGRRAWERGYVAALI